MKNILLVEPFYTGSHKFWADNYKKFSKHNIDILQLPGRHWKWRMHGGAITLAEKFNKMHKAYDLIIASDMLDLNVFKSLINNSKIPFFIYFHENQLIYPWSKNDPDKKKNRDKNYVFKNYASALAADRVLFNSYYHKNSFTENLRKFLTLFPDYNEEQNVDRIVNKSEVWHLGFDFNYYDKLYKPKRNKVPLILWNHRWEYDKNPELFFEVLVKAHKKGYNFEVALLGEKFKETPGCFNKAFADLEDKIIVAGRVEYEQYISYLWTADILPVTSIQDFFGISVMEAVYCNTYPLLPKRLSYPELYSEKQFEKCFYNNKNELFTKFEGLLRAGNIPDIENSSLKYYKWNKVACVYDQYIERFFDK